MSESTEIVLPTSANPNSWSPEQSALMEFAGLVTPIYGMNADTHQREVVGKQYAPASVAQAFIQQCHRTGLDPIAKQIYAMELGGKWLIVVGVDGFRVIAQRSKGYQGQIGPQWTADGTTWVDAWLPAMQGGKAGDKPAAARIGIWREGFREPLWQTITWDEFGKGGGNWAKTPAHMLGIRAETHGLRRTFPNDLSGLYTPEDFDLADEQGDVVQPTQDWKTLINQADDKRVLAELLADMKTAGEWTQELNAQVLARAGMVTKDTRQQSAPDEAVYEADGTPADSAPADPPADVPAEPDQEPDPDVIDPLLAAQGVAPGSAYEKWLAENPAKA